MIKVVVLDIDGVITDGSVIIDSNGREQKRINLKDIDAIYELKRKGLLLAAITGENTEVVEYFRKRFPWDYFYMGNKKKRETLQEMEKAAGIAAEEICYVGDGKYDVEPLCYAGLGICPYNAIDTVKKCSDIILQNNGGEGCLWELLEILESFHTETDSKNYFYSRLWEHADIFKRMAADQKLVQTVMDVSRQILNLLKQEKKLLLCGNGGSAADAQHIATEFVSRFYKERPAMNAEALTVNTSTLTAIGNDYNFERIFQRQVEAKAVQGDMLIGISTSGRSKNILEALRYAKSQRITTVMLMGDFEVPELETLCDYVIKVPSVITPRIQETHIFIGHTMAEYVEHEMFRGEKE